MDLFAGLENLGLKGLENISIYESDAPVVDPEAERLQRLKNELEAEIQHLYDKSYTCSIFFIIGTSG